MKREELVRIKERIAQPGGNFGVAIINAGRSYNKFTTVSYQELARIKSKENKFRKTLGVKKDKRPINNTEKGFKPTIDPKILNAGLKQKRAYYGGGSLNMKPVKGTNQ